MKENQIINRVANSGLLTINPQDFLPQKEIISLDLKAFLFKEFLLKEVEFRAQLKEMDWAQFEGKLVCVFCSNDAIIPHWAYMLVALYLPSNQLSFGKPETVVKNILLSNIHDLDVSNYNDKRVILKGCAHPQIDQECYLELTKKLLPVVKTLMYGEACSTVPVYKKKT